MASKNVPPWVWSNTWGFRFLFVGIVTTAAAFRDNRFHLMATFNFALRRVRFLLLPCGFGFVQEIVHELLNVLGSQFAQLDSSHCGDNVIFTEVPIRAVCLERDVWRKPCPATWSEIEKPSAVPVSQEVLLQAGPSTRRASGTPPIVFCHRRTPSAGARFRRAQPSPLRPTAHPVSGRSNLRHWRASVVVCGPFIV